MDQQASLHDVLGVSVPVLLQSLDEALIILDRNRNIRLVNSRARQLLGYDQHEEIGGRCRHATRGTDCGASCPLTYALESDLETVSDFATTFHTREGRDVPVKVTVILLRDDHGGLTGSVEILRPSEPDPGFFLAGRSEAAQRLRSEVARLADSSSHLLLAGPAPAVADVARTIRRFAGLAESHFHHWQGSWQVIPPWPPGILYLSHGDAADVLGSVLPQGWRLIIEAPSLPAVGELELAPLETFQLPPVDHLRADLPLMIAARVHQLEPRTRLTTEATQRLCHLAEEAGIDRLEEVLATAVAAAGGGTIDTCHLPVDGSSTTFALFDELLQHSDPLTALEERLLREILQRHSWHMQEVADRLGISRVTLWRKMRDHGIERPSGEQQRLVERS